MIASKGSVSGRLWALTCTLTWPEHPRSPAGLLRLVLCLGAMGAADGACGSAGSVAGSHRECPTTRRASHGRGAAASGSVDETAGEPGTPGAPGHAAGRRYRFAAAP